MKIEWDLIISLRNMDRVDLGARERDVFRETLIVMPLK